MSSEIAAFLSTDLCTQSGKYVLGPTDIFSWPQIATSIFFPIATSILLFFATGCKKNCNRRIGDAFCKRVLHTDNVGGRGHTFQSGHPEYMSREIAAFLPTDLCSDFFRVKNAYF